MKKTFLGTLSALVLVLGMAGTASAVVDVNLYGASAEFKFWNEAAPAWLTAPTADSGAGCASATIAAKDASGKNGITQGTNCDIVGGDSINFRYSAKASADGILAMQGDDSMTAVADRCDPEDLGYPGAAMAPFYRAMADEASTDFTTGVVSGTKCVDVSLGASDVEGDCFTQSSFGQLDGHLGGGFTVRVFNGVDASGLTVYRPVVVPFGFFVNSTALPSLTDIVDVAAVNIYSGFASNWSDFVSLADAEYPDKQIVACLRHAGSGTHATLDWTVMKGQLALVTTEDPTGANFGGPVVWFNDGSSDLIRCVDQNGGLSTDTHAAIGYADADKCVGSSSCSSTVAIGYNGSMPTKETIANCQYEFWSAQSLYEDPAEPDFANTHPLVLALDAFMSNGANLATYLPAKDPYWATQGQMNCTRGGCGGFPYFK